LISTKRSFVGWNNYAALIKNPTFQKAVLNTITYTLGVVPVGILLSLVIAVLLNNKLRFQGLFRTAFFTPVITSMVAVAIVWSWLLEPNYGLINSFLSKLGIAGPGWLTDPKWALPSVILLSIWKNLGYNMVIFLAGLQDIPRDVYESADIDGATSRRWTGPGWRTGSPVFYFVHTGTSWREPFSARAAFAALSIS
jgi:multiple sugar transport system permease protein